MITDANILEVDLAIIRKNIENLKKLHDTKFYPVVKSNAYGLGAIEISKEIEDVSDMFCVANINEAIQLREAGIKKDILILGYISPENYKYVEKYNLIANIYNYSIAKELENSGFNIRAHIKIETGHNRLGFQVKEKSIKEIIDISNFKNVKIEGIFSHFSSADEKDREYTNMQAKKFQYIIDELGNISKGWTKHISNDAGIISYDYSYDAVRSGISIYGLYPSSYLKNNYNIGIESAFTLKSKISNIKLIEQGEAISYGRTFISKEKMKIATVSIGYADGYHRLISNRGYVLINGQKAKILGNITMDQMMVDISRIDCNIHDEVVIIGKDGCEEISPELVASWADTISYEIMTSISERVKRIYKN